MSVDHRYRSHGLALNLECYWLRNLEKKEHKITVIWTKTFFTYFFKRKNRNLVAGSQRHLNLPAISNTIFNRLKTKAVDRLNSAKS